jgi:hypothetical protein
MKSQMLVQRGPNRQTAAAGSAIVQHAAGESAFAVNRRGAVAQRSLAETTSHSPRVVQQEALMERSDNGPRLLQQQDFAHNIARSPRMVAQRQQRESLFGGAVQRKRKEELQGKCVTAQRVKRKEEKPLQRKAATESAAQLRAAVAQLYDIKAFDSWEEHVAWLLRKQVNLPQGIKLKIGFLGDYLKKPPAGAKATYLPPGQSGLTEEGVELRDSSARGAVLLSSEYVNEVGTLPKEERVATLLSTIRHELQHAENFRQGLVSVNSDEAQSALDETIAHSENILNRRLGRTRSDAPLWDQLEHLMQAEDYFSSVEKVPERMSDSPLKAVARASLAAAQKKVMEAFSEYSDDPDSLMRRYLDEIDFHPQKENLTAKSEVMGRILQGKFADSAASAQPEGTPFPNRTGLPNRLQSGIESLSGISLDNVKVHLNSSRPAQLNALAYTQGSDIHVAPGQERHLPHEAWHVVQQAQGRVQPTMQLKDRVAVNDDQGLEHEAEVMGAQALQQTSSNQCCPARENPLAKTQINSGSPGSGNAMPIQRVKGRKKKRRKKKNRRNKGNPVLTEPRSQTHRVTGRASETGPPPQHLELGAGEGDYSAAFQNQYARRGQRYLATDLAPRAGPTGFLQVAKRQGVEHEYGVNALNLPQRFGGKGKEPLKQILAANPYGGGAMMPGVGFGLVKYDPVGRGQKPRRSPDPRFIQDALPRVGKTGQIKLLGRSNALYSGLAAQGIPDEDLPERLHATNPYMNPTSTGDLHQIALASGSHIHVTPARPPRAERIGGGAPDTPHRGGLGDFNTQFSITASDRPGVTYSYQRHRYSTNEQVAPSKPVAPPKEVRHVKPVHRKDRKKALAETSATFRSTGKIPRDRQGGKSGKGGRGTRGGKAGRDLQEAIETGLDESYSGSDSEEEDY